jgi:hypothetical protein
LFFNEIYNIFYIEIFYFGEIKKIKMSHQNEQKEYPKFSKKNSINSVEKSNLNLKRNSSNISKGKKYIII